MSQKKKIGRPTAKPLITQFSVRFDVETLGILDKHCKLNNLKRGEMLRKAIKLLDCNQQ